MRSTVARLLRRFSEATGRDYSACKQEWARTPRNKRGALREEIERLLRG